MNRSALGVAALIAAAGCVQSDVTQCGDDVVCSSERTCATVGDRALCVVPEQLTACNGLDDRAACEYSGSIGTCQSSVCLPTICGDGVVSGGEDCEEGVPMALDSCNDLEFYDDVPLQCTACVYDRAACREAGASYCGDMVRDFAEGEYCDGMLPQTNDSCVSFGYDAGALACNTAVCTPGFDDCLRLRWTILAPGAFVEGFWSASASDVWAVGNDGLVAHSDGSTWTGLNPSPTTEDLTAIHGNAADDIYAVGGDFQTNTGLALHFDGTSWTEMTLPAGTKYLEGVWVGGGTGMAVGQDGTVLRLVGGAWTTAASPTTEDLFEVWGASATAIYAGGRPQGATSLFKFDGTTWSPQTLPAVSNIYAITGLSTGQVYVAGESGGLGFAAELDGASWDAIELPCTGTLYDLWAAGPDDIYAGGFRSPDPMRAQTLYHYSGTSWTPIDSPSPLYVQSVWGTSPESIIIGSGNGIAQSAGRLHVQNPRTDTSGTCSSFLPSCAEQPQFAIAGRADDDVFVFGSTNCHYDGANWTAVDPQTPTMTFTNAWVSPTGTAFGVGRGNETNDACASGRTKSTAMIARSTTATTVSAFEIPAVKDTLLNDVWGTDNNNVYAVGSQAPNSCTMPRSPFVLRWNGSSWQEISAPSSLGSLYRVWGISATEIYVMGLGGTFAVYNGTSWTSRASFPQNCPQSLDMTGHAGIVYATCISDRHIYRYDAAVDQWNLVGQPSYASFGTRTSLLALGPDDFFVFGSNADSVGTITSYTNGNSAPVRNDGPPIRDAWGTADRIFWVDDAGVHSLVRTVPW